MEATLMKQVGLIRSGLLLLLLGTVTPTYPQQEQREQETKPPKQEQQVKPEKHERQAKSQQEQQQKQQQQQVKSAKQEQRRQAKDQQEQQQKHQSQQQANRSSQQGQRVQRGQQREVWQQHRARNWQSEHRDWQQRGGYNGYRIPEDRYRGYFGPNHWFRIYRYPVEVYGGYPRFQYGGFWFGLMDPWPEYWSDNWYDNDDVYIVYSEGGYYLYNRRYPRDRITIIVYVN
jgi:hypothetical protein